MLPPSCRYLTLSSTHPKYTWVLNGSQDYDPLCSICYQKLSLHFGVGVGRVETEPTVSEDERLKQVKVKRLTRTKDEDEKNLGTWHLRVFCVRCGSVSILGGSLVAKYMSRAAKKLSKHRI